MSIFDSKEPIPAKDLTLDDYKLMLRAAVQFEKEGDPRSLDSLAKIVMDVCKMTNTPF